jgi:exonuclease III
MIFLSWNCRGFGSKLKAEALKDLKKMASPSVILLQETKMDSSSLLEATKKNFNTTGGAVVSSQGASGGIATLWNEQTWNSEVIFETQNWLLTVLKNKDNNSIIYVVNVYMPNSYKDKMATWNSLSDLRNSIDPSSCIIGGDFNTHLNPGEKKGGNKVRDPFSENLTDLISDWDMQDIKPAKGNYTWNNRRVGLHHIAARLDHFLLATTFSSPPLSSPLKFSPLQSQTINLLPSLSSPPRTLVPSPSASTSSGWTTQPFPLSLQKRGPPPSLAPQILSGKVSSNP